MKSIFQIIDIGEDDIDILDLLNELPVVVENNELFKLKQNEQNIGGCGKRFQPNGKGQRTCEPCKKKKKAMRYKK